MSEDQTYKTFEEFWPHYLNQHSKRQTRLLHVCGTVLAALCLFKFVISFKIGWLLMAPVVGYGFAWAAHAFIEENQPATFEHPLWSLRADLEMTKLWAMGKLEAELAKHQITS
ncbi:MAG: Mpo1-like protein [Bdellovibrionales bacterium]